MSDRQTGHSKIFRITFLGICGALALAVSFCEHGITAALPLPPGVKPGLSNIVVMFVCFSYGLPGALAIAAVKSGFVMLVSGVTSGFISLCGGAVSVITLYIAKKISGDKFSYMGISVLSAVMHNMGQLCASSLTVGSGLYLAYTPVLLISGIVFGSITGIILNAVMPSLIKLTNSLK